MKCTWLVILNSLLKVKEFAMSHAVTYATIVVIYWKQSAEEM